MKPSVCEKTIGMGQNRYRVNSMGEWTVLLFGTSGPGQTPHYFYSSISKEDVPKSVIEASLK